MEDCLFCKKPVPEDSIYETDRWCVFLAWDQTYPGRCIISLKRHCENLSQLEEDEWREFSDIVRVMEKTLKKSFDTTLFNWICMKNTAYKKPNPKPHVHWNLIPRYKDKVVIKEFIFEDEEFGDHYDRNKTTNIPSDIREEIISIIKKNL